MIRLAARLLLLVSPLMAAAPWSIGYWNSLGNPACPVADIDMAALTHISHWAAIVKADGGLDLNYHKMAADAPALIEASHAAGVKVLFSVVNPYWMGQKGNLPEAAANHRAALVRNIMSAVDAYGYDGVNIDWEGAPPDIGPLAADLRARLGSRALTADAVITDYKYWGSVEASFDRINVMTYDLAGAWNPYAWHNAALEGPDDSVWSIDLAVQRFTANGAPASKLGIGIPFFGYQWTGPGLTGPGKKWSEAPKVSQMPYRAIAPLIAQRSRQWDAAAHVPFLSGPDSFITYDDERSIKEKIDYVKAHGLGGWIIWNLSLDYVASGPRRHPLLAAVAAARR